MDWIKKNPAQFGLAIVSVGLIAATYFLYDSASAFPSSFDGSKGSPSNNKDVPVVDTGDIDKATKAVGEPASWTTPKDGTRWKGIFVGRKRVVEKERIVTPDEGCFNPPVSNTWLDKYALDFLDSSILTADSDKDGFSNLLEFLGTDTLSHIDMNCQPAVTADGKPLTDDSTSPIDPKAHPAYDTRLQVASIVPVPFRLRFMMADIDLRKPQNNQVQINTIDRGNRTYFVPIGELIPGTLYKTESYQEKKQQLPGGTEKDVSELTIIHTVTKKKVILPLAVVVDSPESYLVLRYLWVAPGGQPTPDKQLTKDQEFSIPPEMEKKYKILDIRKPEVDIQLPNGNKITLKESN